MSTSLPISYYVDCRHCTHFLGNKKLVFHRLTFHSTIILLSSVVNIVFVSLTIYTFNELIRSASELDKPIFDKTYFKIKLVNNSEVQEVYILCNNEKAVILLYI